MLQPDAGYSREFRFLREVHSGDVVDRVDVRGRNILGEDISRMLVKMSGLKMELNGKIYELLDLRESDEVYSVHRFLFVESSI